MRPTIEKINALEKYKLFVRFSDGTEGILDVQDLAGKGVFQSWEEGDAFFRVFISPESGAITWPPNLDIDTYQAYCDVKGITPEDFFQAQTIHAAH